MLVLAHDSFGLTIDVMYTAMLFVILYIVFLCYRTFHARKKRKTSLPTNWPILGMMPALLQNSGRVQQFATELVQPSGGTFLLKGPWFSNMDMLITCDPANIHYILTKNFQNFGKGPDFKKIFELLGEGIFIAESESWENQRKITKSLINHASFQEFVVTTSLKKVETGLTPILELVSENGNKVDIQELFKRLAFDCSCILVLGHDPVSLSNDLPHLPHEKAFADAEEAALYRHVIPEILWKMQKWLHIGKEEKLARAMETIPRFLSYCISLKNQKSKSINPTKESDPLARAIVEKVNISEEVLRDNLLNLIFAGKDTISAALTWFFWLIATNPQEQEKIRQETLTNNSKFGNMEELKRLIYLHAALCETLRLFPPVALQHKAPLEHDILPSGHKIKPNTKTILSFYSMGRVESIWGKDCLEFKPGRWISDSGRIKYEPSYKFTAFNAGPRSCLGKEMSFVQMKIIAAAIISRFKIEVVEGHPISPSSSVVLHMKYGLKVKVSSYV